MRIAPLAPKKMNKTDKAAHMIDSIPTMSSADDREQLNGIAKKYKKMQEILVIIAAQDSGEVGSTKRSDAMAAMAEIALRFDPLDNNQEKE